jgi:hypothetical protein
MFRQEWRYEDKEYIIKEGHDEQDGSDFDGIQFNCFQKEHAHARPKDILYNPIEHDRIRMGDCKGNPKPNSAHSIR